MVSYPASSPVVTGVGGTFIPVHEYHGDVSARPSGTRRTKIPPAYLPSAPFKNSPGMTAQEFGYLCAANPTSATCAASRIHLMGRPPGRGRHIGLVRGRRRHQQLRHVDDNGVCNDGIPQPSYQSGISLNTVAPMAYGIPPPPLVTARCFSAGLAQLPRLPGLHRRISNGQARLQQLLRLTDHRYSGHDERILAGTGNCSIFGGTSVSTPIFAGIVTMLNQYTDRQQLPSPVGNINPNLYTLAASNPSNHAFNPVTNASTGSYSEARSAKRLSPGGRRRSVAQPRWCARAAAPNLRVHRL